MRRERGFLKGRNSMTAFDTADLDTIIKRYGKDKDQLTSILQEIQDKYRHLPDEALQYVSEKLDLPVSQLFGVATFYSSFTLEPRGRHLISVCLGTACHVKNGNGLFDRVVREAGTTNGGTSEDLHFSVEKVRCLGCCSLAPVMKVDRDIYGSMTQQKVSKVLEKYRA
jgi:NADH:ubiquinone oxidoreductase subunit E